MADAPNAHGAIQAGIVDNLPNKVLAAEYRTVLPDVERLAEELARSQRELQIRRPRVK